MARNSQTEGSQNKSQAAAPQQHRLSKDKIIALKKSLVVFLDKEKKSYKDLNSDLINAFLMWNATQEKDGLLQTLTQDISRINISINDLGGSTPALSLATQQALVEAAIGKIKRALQQAKVEKDVADAFDSLFVADTFQDVELLQTALRHFAA